jgi:hypothetical protein
LSTKFKFGVVDFCFVRTSQGKLQDDLKKSEALCVQMKAKISELEGKAEQDAQSLRSANEQLQAAKAAQEAQSLRSAALEQAASAKPPQSGQELERLRRARNKYRDAYLALGTAIENSKQTLDDGTNSAGLRAPDDDSDASETESDQERA